VVVIQSPVGLPVRVIKTPLVERVLLGEREPFHCPYKCLLTCDKSKVPFCMAQVLLKARAGNQDHGLYMTGCNVEPIKEVVTVKQFFDTLS
jgi:nitronate monooxygenase